MNKVSVVIAALGGWEEYTLPAINSIRVHEPDVEIVIVDSAPESDYPDWQNIIKTEPMSYGEAINVGIESCTGDWFLSINNDVICNAPFVHIVEKLQPAAIYGRQIIEELGHVWLGNWLALIPRAVREQVGWFDGGFKKCGFEDADYCIRAKTMGIPTLPVELPFTHLWGRTRWSDPKYPIIREENIKYFEQKHGFRLGNSMRVTHD